MVATYVVESSSREGLPFLIVPREERRDLDLARPGLLPVLALDAIEVFPEHGHARSVSEDVGQRFALRLLDVTALEVELHRARRAADHDVAHRVRGDAEAVRVLELLRGLLVAVDRRQPLNLGDDRRRVPPDKPHPLVPWIVAAAVLPSLRVVVRPRYRAFGPEERDDRLVVHAAVPFAGLPLVVVARRRLGGEQRLHQFAAHRLRGRVQPVLELARAADAVLRDGVGRAFHQRRRARCAPEGDLEDFF